MVQNDLETSNMTWSDVVLSCAVQAWGTLSAQAVHCGMADEEDLDQRGLIPKERMGTKLLRDRKQLPYPFTNDFADTKQCDTYTMIENVDPKHCTLIAVS